MKPTSIVRLAAMGAFALLLVAYATPVQAQVGSLRGKVVDEAGQPVAGAEITFDFIGDYNRQFTTKTDSKGEWVRAGMPSGGGTWTLTVRKGDLGGIVKGIRVSLQTMTRVEDIVLKPGGADPSKIAASNMSEAEIKKRNARQEQLELLFNEANAAIEASNYDEAIVKLTSLTTEVPDCAACQTKLGEVYLKKNDVENAEKAYLKSIEIDPTAADPYNALATIYNQQKRFDEASKMSGKANELSGDTGGSPEAVFNQGIIFWNQSKIEDARVQFEKATRLDPTMADAFYWLGMALVNQGKLPDAKKPFEEYLKLAPTGQYVDTAKAMLAMIK
jgi:tetratricopeptide (TPR) repeat protein